MNNFSTYRRIEALCLMLITASLLTLLSACQPVKRPIPVKPFYVIEKDASDYLSCKYTIVDANNNQFEFVDEREKYNLGDTIK